MTNCMCEDDIREWVAGSQEYLSYEVTADVELDVQPVKITFDRVALIPAQWDGAGTWNTEHILFTRKCRSVDLVTDDDFPTGETSFQVFVQVADTEIPFIEAGSITVI